MTKISKLNSKFTKNLENKLEIYSYFKLENKLEIFEFFVNGRWSQYKCDDFSDWMCDLNGNKWMHASEQQIVIIKSEQQNLIEIPDFLSTTEGCPLLRAFTK